MASEQGEQDSVDRRYDEIVRMLEDDEPPRRRPRLRLIGLVVTAALWAVLVAVLVTGWP